MEKFNQMNGLRLIARAHQLVMEGHKVRALLRALLALLVWCGGVWWGPGWLAGC